MLIKQLYEEGKILCDLVVNCSKCQSSPGKQVCLRIVEGLFHSHGQCLPELGSGELEGVTRSVYSLSSDLLLRVDCVLSSELGVGRQQKTGLMLKPSDQCR